VRIGFSFLGYYLLTRKYIGVLSRVRRPGELERVAQTRRYRQVQGFSSRRERGWLRVEAEQESKRRESSVEPSDATDKQE
jgi:hypothetical protein